MPSLKRSETWSRKKRNWRRVGRDWADALAAEREKKLTDQSAETLAEKIAAGDAELKQLGMDIGGIHQILSANEQQKSSQQERLPAIDLQKKECLPLG